MSSQTGIPATDMRGGNCGNLLSAAGGPFDIHSSLIKVGQVFVPAASLVQPA
ncbi:hypothetical protein JHL22_13285 [Advenella sp. WQ 585]|uniref:Uncharacterized protein n=1 Tax=Advenella mandrilli TaxID=2800330 RepID=A0ABS1EGQ7_9BURK|nr:hypothetical protein [Advenella mandrilli]MBK1782186.1 hypothetical protein [Advenella mandrilli]